MVGDDLCASSPCWNGGTCINLFNDWTCQCLSGYSGKNCRVIEATPCTTNNPCQNGANCQSISTNGNTDKSTIKNARLFFNSILIFNTRIGILQPVCYCVGAWTGPYCESPIPFCDRPSPCFNGGVCVDNACKCTKNFIGSQCETFSKRRETNEMPTWGSFINNLLKSLFIRFFLTQDPQITDKQVKVYNKGFFLAKIKIVYEEQNSFSKYLVEQSANLFLGSEHIFHIPISVNYDSLNGVKLIAEVMLGPNLIEERILTDPECFHLWGIFFMPAYARVPCW
jgi:hypothetical protein